VLHGHEFAGVLGVEGPCVDDLLAMGVDDFDELPFGDARRLALRAGMVMSDMGDLLGS
jgi:hypothetical protein